MNKRLIKKNSKGQSTIEFIFVAAFAFGFLFVFIQLAINLTGGFYAHYATFMASRTFLIYDRGDADPNRSYGSQVVRNEVQDVFDSYFTPLKYAHYGIYDPNASLKIQSKVTDPNIDYIYTGVILSYTQPMSLFAYFGGNVDSVMISESLLGKEPTRGECLERTRKAIEGTGPRNSDQEKFVTVYDNGC